MNKPTLTTERLVLRRFTEKDLDALLAILRDEEVNRFLPWLPARSFDDARHFFEERLAPTYTQPQGYAYSICLRENDLPIGYVNVDAGDAHDLGYALRKEFWHRGIVTEAARAVVDQARRDGLPYLTATHDRENPRSGGVMRNIGMTYRYSYEERWQPKDILVTFRLYQLNLDGNEERVYRKYWDESVVHFIEEGLVAG